MSVEARDAVYGVPVGVRKRALVGCGAIVALLLCVFAPSAPDHEPPAFDLVGDENHGRVDLAGGEGTPLGEEASASRRRSEGTGAIAMTGESSSLGWSSEDGKAYQEAVESFAESYGDTIDHTNPLVHKMLMHSEGADRMTKTEVEELGGLLSDMGEAPDSEVIGSYPEGYEDCDGYLRAGATSLSLAADSIHGFNETADMEYLRDYRRLIAMYMRAVGDAQWCVSDHLRQAYP
jgi:hypothetical protein